jgi:nickel-dependent lactate racemase
MAWKKKEKRIVSKTAEVVPTKLVIQEKTKFERAGGVDVLCPKVEGKARDEEIERAEIRRKVGLTYEQLCETVAKGLMAMVCNAETGEPICPANSERAKFVQAAIDLLGAKKAEAGAQKIPSIIIVLPNGQRL